MMRGRFRNWPLVALCLLFLVVSPICTWGQKAQPEKGAGLAGPSKVLQSDSPLKIASDRMEANQNDKTVVFEGHVVVQQDDLTITGKRLKVYAAEARKDAAASAGMVEKKA